MEQALAKEKDPEAVPGCSPQEEPPQEEQKPQLHYEPTNRRRHQRTITNPFRLMAMAREAAGELGIENASPAEDDESNKQPPAKAVFDDLHSAHVSITSRKGRGRAGTVFSRPTYTSASSSTAGELPAQSNVDILRDLPSLPGDLPDPSLLGILRDLPSPPNDLVAQSSADAVRHLPSPPGTALRPTLLETQDLPSLHENGPESIFVEVDLGPAPTRDPRNPSDLEGQTMPQRRTSVIDSFTSYVRNVASSIRPSSFLSTSNGQVKLGDDVSVYRSDAARSFDIPSTLRNLQDGNLHDRNHVNHLQREDLFLPEMAFSSSPMVSTNPFRRGQNVTSSSSNISTREGSTVNEIFRQYGTSTSSPGGVLGLTNSQMVANGNYDAAQPQGSQVSTAELERETRYPSESSYGDSQVLLGVEAHDHQYQGDAAHPDIPTIGIEHVRSEHALSVAVSTVPSLTDVNWRKRYSTTPDTRLARDESIRQQMYADNQCRSIIEVPEAPTTVTTSLERDISLELRRASGIDDSFDDPDYNEYLARYEAAHNNRGRRRDDFYDFEDSSSIRSTESGGTIRQVGGGTRRRSVDSSFYNPAAIPSDWIYSHDNVRVPITQPPPAIPLRSPHRPRPVANNLPPASISARPSQDDDDWVTIDGSVVGGRDSLHGFRRVGRPESFLTSTSEAQSDSRLSEDEYGSKELITQHPAPVAGASNYRRRELTNGNRPVLLPVSNQYRVNGFPSNSSRLRPPNPIYQNPPPLRNRHQHPFGSSPPEVLLPSRQPPSRQFRAKAQNQFPPSTSTITSDGSATTAHRPDSRRPRQRSDRHQRQSRAEEWMENTITTAPGSAFENGPRSNTTTRRERPSSLGLVTAFAAGESVDGYEMRDGRIVRTDGVEEVEEEMHLYPKTPSRVRLPVRPPVGEFRYRSPAAPPKSEAYRQMYTQDQLVEMDELAKHGLRANRVTSVGSEALSQRHIRQAPILGMFEEPPLPPVVKQHWNVIYLITCAFFPPLLLCYAGGWLDYLLERRTDGRMLTFSKSYKRIAVLLFVAELAVVIIAVVFSTINKA